MKKKTLINKMMIRPMVLLLLLPAAFRAGAQDEIRLLAGTYNDTARGGLYSFSFNQQTGRFAPLDTLDLRNPSFLTVTMDGSTIYAVSENGDSSSCVSAVAFDERSGRMTLRGSRPTNGDPCYVESNDNLLVTANYGGGSISVFPLNIDGSLNAMNGQFGGAKKGPDATRQNEPHIHCARFLPDGSGIIATDFTGDRLLHLVFDGRNRPAEPRAVATLTPGSGPRHIAFSADSRFLYVMSELTGAVTVFRWNYGKPQKVQEIATDHPEGRAGSDIHLTPDGRFLYAANRLQNDGLTIFNVDRKSGRLAKAGYQATGRHPRHFNITPNGRFLLCACRDENSIRIYRIDAANGLLTDTNERISLPRPACVRFYPYVMQPDIPGNGVFRVIERTVTK